MQRNILIIETDAAFRKDIERRRTLGDYDSFDLCYESRMDSIEASVNENVATEAVVNADLLDSYPDWNIGVPVTCYARNASGLKKAAENEIPCFGMTARAVQLLDKIKEGKVIVINKDDNDEQKERAERKTNPANRQAENDNVEDMEFDAAEETEEEDDIVSRKTSTKRKKKERPAKRKPQEITASASDDEEDNDDDYASDEMTRRRRGARREQPKRDADSKRKRPWNEDPANDRDDGYEDRYYDYDDPYEDEYVDEYEEDEDYGRGPSGRNGRSVRSSGSGRNKKTGSSRYSDYDDEYDDDAYTDDDKYDEYEDDGYEDEDPYEDRYTPAETRKRADSRQSFSRSGTERARSRKNVRDRRNAERENRRAKREFEKDIAGKKQETKVITVFSAKGGVGKTTIATELATYLSLISNGRNKYRVCIVDYNIDFGDVVQTLNLDSDVARERSCLTIWAEDIRERIQNGENPKRITFTKKEIERYLLYSKDSGLYALAAPISNDDSIGIDTIEMQIVIDNLIRFGEFDFIICDTGNNTRDSTTICLERADLVLMVITQNINTINCNDSLINTLYKINFDLSKFRVVVNKVKPEKAVKLSLDDARSIIENPETNRPIECIAVINDSDSVRAANNEGMPLVYTANNAFTNSMKEIASYIFGDEHVISDVETKKPGFFARLFGRKS